ncbi:MAG: 50S ribosomal protein L25 [Acidimicrobiales bacterium]|nr:50S ribosomal protein L25 [Acidimicrobiales bacterium]
MDLELIVEPGRPCGTRHSRRLRAAGKVPGVVYGLGKDPVPVTVAWPELRRVLTTEAGQNALINLTVGEGESSLSIVKELQRHPVRREVLHVDFQLIDPNAPLAVEVPVVLVGRAEKVEQRKGIIDQLRHSIVVKAKPGNIPTQLDADVSGLEIGTAITVGDIVLPEGVTTDLDPETPVAQGSPTRSTILLDAQAARAQAASGTGGSAEGEATAAEPSGDAEAGGDD